MDDTRVSSHADSPHGFPQALGFSGIDGQILMSYIRYSLYRITSIADMCMHANSQLYISMMLTTRLSCYVA